MQVSVGLGRQHPACILFKSLALPKTKRHKKQFYLCMRIYQQLQQQQLQQQQQQLPQQQTATAAAAAATAAGGGEFMCLA
ncbi:hypothetical protein Emag_007000 [Eimeria magna]